MHKWGETRLNLGIQRKYNCWSMVGTLTLKVLGLLLFFGKVVAQFSPNSTSQSVHHDIIGQDISCDQVCEYDDWFRRAHCEGRNLYKVPSSDGCEDATMLELQENHLTNISVNSLFGYNHLKTLDLNNNDITVICPGVFLNIIHLRNILINNNNLNELLNRTFTGTENHLTRIYLQRNNIVNIHEHAFQGLTALTSIYLSYNRIRSLPSTVFHGLTRLQYIMLGYNELDHLDAPLFRDLTELQTLSLRNNKLKWLPHGLFHGLSSLREVVLSNNELYTLPSPENLGIASINKLYIGNNNLTKPGSIIPYMQITHVHLNIHNNSFRCDCAFITIQQWYSNKTEETFDRNSVTCNLGGRKYNLDDILPISCDQPTSNIMPLNESIQENATNIIQHNTTDGYLLHKPSHTSEVLQPNNDMLQSNEYLCQRYQCNQYCADDESDKKILILSCYCVACVTVFFLSWICYTLYNCFSSIKHSAP